MSENQFVMIEFSESGQFLLNMSIADEDKKCNYCADIVEMKF
jgi:hypothetical protein